MPRGERYENAEFRIKGHYTPIISKQQRTAYLSDKPFFLYWETNV